MPRMIMSVFVSVVLAGITGFAAQLPFPAGAQDRGVLAIDEEAGSVCVLVRLGGRRIEHVRHRGLRGCGDVLGVPGRGVLKGDGPAGAVRMELDRSGHGGGRRTWSARRLRAIRGVRRARCSTSTVQRTR